MCVQLKSSARRRCASFLFSGSYSNATKKVYRCYCLAYPSLVMLTYTRGLTGVVAMHCDGNLDTKCVLGWRRLDVRVCLRMPSLSLSICSLSLSSFTLSIVLFLNLFGTIHRSLSFMVIYRHTQVLNVEVFSTELTKLSLTSKEWNVGCCQTKPKNNPEQGIYETFRRIGTPTPALECCLIPHSHSRQYSSHRRPATPKHNDMREWIQMF